MTTMGKQNIHLIFRNQVGFKLPREHFHIILRSINHTIDYGLDNNGDLFVVEKTPTLDHHVLQRFIFWMGAPSIVVSTYKRVHLFQRHHNWKFLVIKNLDFIAIQKSNTNNKKT